MWDEGEEQFNLPEPKIYVRRMKTTTHSRKSDFFFLLFVMRRIKKNNNSKKIEKNTKSEGKIERRDNLKSKKKNSPKQKLIF